MKEIIFQLKCSATPQKLFDALSSGNEISKWWTTSASLKPKEGAIGTFQWKAHSWTVKVKIKRIEPTYIEWICISSNMQNTNAWENTILSFNIEKTASGGSLLLFKQTRYKNSPCFDICNDGWTFVLGKSLKEYVETGAGHPYHS